MLSQVTVSDVVEGVPIGISIDWQDMSRMRAGKTAGEAWGGRWGERAAGRRAEGGRRGPGHLAPNLLIS